MLIFVALGIAPLAELAAAVVNGLVFISDSVIDMALSWEYSYFNVATPSIIVIVSFALLLWLFSKDKPRFVKRKRYVAIGLVGALLICFLLPKVNLFGNYSLSIIDIAQAESALLVTPQNKTIMVDAGAPYGADDTAEYTLAPYIYKNGNSKIDYLVISHAHDDHVERLTALGLVREKRIAHDTEPCEGADVVSVEPSRLVWRDADVHRATVADRATAMNMLQDLDAMTGE